ncbi:hypothetical protein [uncultured Nostoc sp.]|nr:hypothetical protein [uncultured Nostoc sp.]
MATAVGAAHQENQSSFMKTPNTARRKSLIQKEPVRWAALPT